MALTFKKLDHVQICIPDGEEAKAREFYGGILGLKEIEKPDTLKQNGGMWYKIADIELHIGTEDLITPGKRHPAFIVEDLDAAKTYLEKHNVKTKEDTPIPGVKRFSFFDPFENRIELLTKG